MLANIRLPVFACVTVIVRVVAPGAVIVITPVLAAVPLLAVALILNEPFPVRFAGLNVFTVSHDALLVTVHVLLDVTVIVVCCATDDGVHALTDNVRVAAGAACVTVTVRDAAPGADTVIMPVLAIEPVLAVTFNLNEPLPVRFVGSNVFAVSHVALLEAAHDVPAEETVIETSLA